MGFFDDVFKVVGEIKQLQDELRDQFVDPELVQVFRETRDEALGTVNDIVKGVADVRQGTEQKVQELRSGVDGMLHGQFPSEQNSPNASQSTPSPTSRRISVTTSDDADDTNGVNDTSDINAV